jgi:hypothetical protein
VIADCGAPIDRRGFHPFGVCLCLNQSRAESTALCCGPAISAAGQAGGRRRGCWLLEFCVLRARTRTRHSYLAAREPESTARSRLRPIAYRLFFPCSDSGQGSSDERRLRARARARRTQNSNNQQPTTSRLPTRCAWLPVRALTCHNNSRPRSLRTWREWRAMSMTGIAGTSAAEQDGPVPNIFIVAGKKP